MYIYVKYISFVHIERDLPKVHSASCNFFPRIVARQSIANIRHVTLGSMYLKDA